MSKGGKLSPVLFRGEGKWNSLIADAIGKWAALSYPPSQISKYRLD
jgi:hypothetical protein